MKAQTVIKCDYNLEADILTTLYYEPYSNAGCFHLAQLCKREGVRRWRFDDLKQANETFKEYTT